MRPYKATFGDRLADLRHVTKMKQGELAQALGFTPHQISQYERNAAQPSNDQIVAMADFFNVSVDYLLCRVRAETDYRAYEKPFTDDDSVALVVEKMIDLSAESKEMLSRFITFLAIEDRRKSL